LNSGVPPFETLLSASGTDLRIDGFTIPVPRRKSADALTGDPIIIAIQPVEATLVEVEISLLA